MNFVSSVFKKYLKKNENNQETKSEIVENRNFLQNTPIVQLEENSTIPESLLSPSTPTPSSSSAIVEEESLFHDAENLESVEKSKGTSSASSSLSSDIIEADSLNTSIMIDSLEMQKSEEIPYSQIVNNANAKEIVKYLSLAEIIADPAKELNSALIETNFPIKELLNANKTEQNNKIIEKCANKDAIIEEILKELLQNVGKNREKDEDEAAPIIIDEELLEEVHHAETISNNIVIPYNRQETQEFERLEKECNNSEIEFKTESNNVNNNSTSSTAIIENILNNLVEENINNNADEIDNSVAIVRKLTRQDTQEYEIIEKKCIEDAEEEEEVKSAEWTHTSVIQEEPTEKVNNCLLLTKSAESIPPNYELIKNFINLESKREIIIEKSKTIKAEVRPNIRITSPSNKMESLESLLEKNVNLDLKTTIQQYQNLMDEYEHQILEQATELENLKNESKINMRHFTNSEMAFSDVFEKYEKAKAIITAYGRNEDILLENLKCAEQQLIKLESKCLTMKQQAEEQIKQAQLQVQQEKQKYQQDITMLKAVIKRLEIKAFSLETALTQKTEECCALANLCDDITGRTS